MNIQRNIQVTSRHNNVFNDFLLYALDIQGVMLSLSIRCRYDDFNLHTIQITGRLRIRGPGRKYIYTVLVDRRSLLLLLNKTDNYIKSSLSLSRKMQRSEEHTSELQS